MRLMFLVALSLCAAMLSGCYPAFGSYYHVSSIEGRASGEQCHGGSGPPDMWEIVQGGMRIDAGPATYGPLAGKVFTVLFYVPTDKTIELDESAIHILDGTGTNSLSSAAPAIYVFQGKGFVPLLSQGTLDGSKYPDPIARGAMFRVEIALDAQMPQQFQLRMPQMTINGTSYPAATVTYEYRSGVWIGLLNC